MYYKNKTNCFFLLFIFFLGLLFLYLSCGNSKQDNKKLKKNAAITSTAQLSLKYNRLKSVTNSKDTNSELQVTFLDVNHGQSIFIRLPDNSTMLIDAGKWNYYKERVKPFLKKELKDQKLAYLFLTHYHPDHHAGDMPIPLNNGSMNIIFHTFGEENKTIYLDNYSKNYKLYNTDNEENVYVLCEKTKLYILSRSNDNDSPPIFDIENENNASLVFKLTYKNSSFLMTGDIELQTQKRLVKKYKHFLKSDLMSTPHHGYGDDYKPFITEYVKPYHSVTSASNIVSFLDSYDDILTYYKEANTKHKATFQKDNSQKINNITYITNGNGKWILQ